MEIDYNLNCLIKELNITLAYDMYLEAPAFYSSDFDIIVINTKLNELDQKKALLHELGHACLHKKNNALYQVTVSMHGKIEAEANRFMLKNLLNTYLSDPEFNLQSFNAIYFLEVNQLSYDFIPIIQALYLDYMKKNKQPLFFAG